MVNVRIYSAELEDNYTSIIIYVKIKGDEVEKRFYIRYTNGEIMFRNDNYSQLKELYKILDVVRGFMTDKRNFTKFYDKIKEKLSYYNQLVLNSDNNNDRRFYFKCQESGVNALNKLAQNMGINEDMTKELRENLERNKEESGVTE